MNPGIIDGHNDLAWAMRQLNGYDLDAYPLDVRQDRTRTDLVRLAEGGVGGQFWSVYVPFSTGSRAVATTLEQIDFVLRMVGHYPDHLALALTRGGRRACRASRAGWPACSAPRAGTASTIPLQCCGSCTRSGVRYLTLTHNQNLDWADAATDEPKVGGLTDFGRDVVREMNTLGMLVDLSHVAPTTMRHALETSTAPVVFSHSSARALVDHPRNVPDDVLTTLAAQRRGVHGDLRAGLRLDGLPRVVTRRGGRDGRARARTPATGRCGRRPRRGTPSASLPRSPPSPRSPTTSTTSARSPASSTSASAATSTAATRCPRASPTSPGTRPCWTNSAARRWSDAELAALARGNVLRVLRDAEAASPPAANPTAVDNVCGQRGDDTRRPWGRRASGTCASRAGLILVKPFRDR